MRPPIRRSQQTRTVEAGVIRPSGRRQAGDDLLDMPRQGRGSFSCIQTRLANERP